MSGFEAIHRLAESMSARVRAQEIFANNLANLSTDGFRRQRVAFVEVLGKEREQQTVSSRVDRTPGPVVATGRPADVALRGGGFLVVRTSAGERYTRDGGLTVNGAGEIADRHGNPVLGTGGPLVPGTADFVVDERGTVLSAGAEVGRLRVVEFTAEAVLEPVGGGLLSSSVAPTDAEFPDLLPGHREASNVDVIGEMVAMMESIRNFEVTARALRTYDETTGGLIQTARQSVR